MKRYQIKLHIMPEAPEVYDYYKFVKNILNNETITCFDLLSGKYTKKIPNNYNKLKKLLPLKIKCIFVKGKNIYILFENNYGIIFTHGMTGYWSDIEEKHSRIHIKTNSDKDLYFVDPRNFGRVSIVCSLYEFKEKVDYLGPYVLNKKITFDIFYSRINLKPNTKIGIILMDQKYISGIGNYLRCDILWYSKICPDTKIKDLTNEQKKSLFINTINICRYYCGFSYNLKFTPDDFDRENFIYMQETDPFGNNVYKKTFGSRTLHYI